MCEGEGSRTNATTTPNVDAVIDETEDTFGESEFVDDEHPVSDDDDLYDNYVDNKEWVGIRSKKDKDKGVEEENITMNYVQGYNDV